MAQAANQKTGGLKIGERKLQLLVSHSGGAQNDAKLSQKLKKQIGNHNRCI